MDTSKHHLILIRERDAQLAASGCCGRIEGDAARWTASGENLFAERREQMRRIGALYRAVRARFGDVVRISVIDPRNAPALVLVLARDAIRYRVSPPQLLRTAVGIGATAAVLDGVLLFRGEVPRPDDALRVIARRCGFAPVASGKATRA